MNNERKEIRNDVKMERKDFRKDNIQDRKPSINKP